MGKNITFEELRKFGKEKLFGDPEKAEKLHQKLMAEQKTKEMLKRIKQSTEDDSKRKNVLGAINKLIQDDED